MGRFVVGIEGYGESSLMAEPTINSETSAQGTVPPPNAGNYTEADISVLKGLEGVRKRGPDVEAANALDPSQLVFNDA